MKEESIHSDGLPHSDELERSVLGMMLLSTDALSKAVALLDEDTFYRERNRHIFSALSAVYAEHGTVDLVILSDTLTKRGVLNEAGGITYLADVATSAGSTVNVVHHCHALLEKAARRKTIGLADQMKVDAVSDPDNWFTVAGKYEAELQSITGGSKVSALEHVGQFAGDVYDSLGKNRIGVMTHLPWLNRKTNGFQKGEVVVIGARPGVGKTALALGFALHAALKENVPVAIFSLEMLRERLIKRLIYGMSGINTKGRVPTEKEWSKLGAATARLERAPLYIDDESGITAYQIHARADVMKRRHGLGMVVIDYLGLIRSVSTRGKKYEELEETMQAIQTMAKRLECPVLLLSQVTRSVAHEKRPPKLADLFGGTTIEATCDIALMLHRASESLEKGTDEYKAKIHDADISLEKNRDGENGLCSLYWNPETTTFTQLNLDDDDYAYVRNPAEPNEEV
jgi:replicative DNA helicase